MSMAHALEVRSPFLDDPLLEQASQLAPSAKLRGLSLKRVLKHAMSDLLPPEVLHRRKHGFALPLDSWFRNELRGYLEGASPATVRPGRVTPPRRGRWTEWSVSTCPAPRTTAMRCGR